MLFKMKELVSSYNPFYLSNSPVEFVVVGRKNGDFRPIVVSDNCGLDLLGYAASQSYSSHSSKFRFWSAFNPFRKAEDYYVPQVLELTISSEQVNVSDGGRESTVLFFWRGVRLNDDGSYEVRRVAEINLSIILKEIHKIDRKLPDSSDCPESRDKGIPRDIDIRGFLSWHISPIIRIIQSYNLDHVHLRDFSRFFSVSYIVIVLLLLVSLMFPFFSRMIQ